MKELDKLYNDLINVGTSEQNAVLDALMSVNGFEQGIIDYYAYYVTGQYTWNINDVIEDFYKE